ncbi:MAG TPA: hypothetical protein VKB78_15765, partial [Pirellulales bacterium]|nr:hypothetical protein [Pirellulales bacterium]
MRFVPLAAIGLLAVIGRGADLAAPAQGYSAAGAQTTPAVEPSAAPSAATATTKTATTSKTAAPAPGKSIPSPTINSTVTEWVVFVSDVSEPQINARNLFPDSLPPLVDDLRASRPVPVRAYVSPYGMPVATSSDEDTTAVEPTEKPKPSDPMPIGLIRFTANGPLEKDAAVDVQLSYKNGRALGHWPRAKVRSSGILWQDLHLGETKTEPHKLPEGSWLESLRAGGLPIMSGSTRESFLLYDVELNYPLAMRVTGGKEGKYSVAQGTDAPLHDFTLYKRGADGRWQTASIASLAKSAGVGSSAAKADGSPADALSGVLNTITGALQPAKVVAPQAAARVVVRAAGGAAAPKPSTVKD